MGKRMEEGKKFEIYAGCSQPDEKSKELTGIMPVKIIWENNKKSKVTGGRCIRHRPPFISTA